MLKDLQNEAIHLLGLNRPQLVHWLTSIGQSAYRATQLLQWIHQRGVIQFEEMTNLNKSFRTYLKDHTKISPPLLLRDEKSHDGTRKWVFQLEDKNAIETVFIPEEGRGTLCISSQVGCTLNCTFCRTGKEGFNRNLSTAEIIGQVWQAKQILKKTSHEKITNIVFMGMGEPLYNLEHVVAAILLLRDDYAYGFSKRKVTVSTAGVVPGMEKLKALSDCSLAVSLHAPSNILRNQLVPLNKKYPLEKLMDVCRNYFPPRSRRKVLFEYVMLQGVNDEPKTAIQLAALLKDIPSKVNLIPFNPFPNSGYQRSSSEHIEQFKSLLHQNGLRVLVRKTRGEDIQAACGQLVGEVHDRTRRHLLLKKIPDQC
ncbi:MAG: 23S rRNA (adenine(2503)-C(2))-methyltransferase RlmN [Gammaproteobacteria bacterium]|nr:23S rRNA (adenine(2503)-C(2))-methyltransferase RlmN [Gammaproteobacteria bacterium]